ncbi:helix-hairpin-helix domain-containing protein [Vogesella urethralis]|uniref:helix-hairpin-helix domain-containing protein n=1 Tax=Vogesella urethralis TaxID=2592656 RepID=UPI00147855E2|nr:helix-hairpin-helix domain-containing protein [Vogesella urethralis]
MKWWIGVAVAMAGPAWGLEVNTASVPDLVEAGFSQREAQAIVSAREQQGAFTRSSDLLGVSGVTQGDLNRVRGSLTVAGEAVSNRSGTRPAVPGERPA